MTISYTLVPMPKWYFADLLGRPLGGGSLLTSESLNPSIRKPVYKDPSNLNPWPNPILFDKNGEQGPFFWVFDTSQPNKNYYLELYDANGILQWTMPAFGPGLAGGGGGGSVTTIVAIKNFLTNNLFWRNIGILPDGQAGDSPLATSLRLAPSSHAGLTEPDILFLKSNTSAVDILKFIKFGLSNDPFSPTDVTPEFYLNYACTNTPSGETYKYVQWPVDLHVKNFEGQTMTASIWARNETGAGSPSITLNFQQFFGSGVGVTSPVNTLIGTIPLTSVWTKYIFTFLVPNNAGSIVLSGCGDDASYFQVNYPLGSACSVSFAKPTLYLGQITAPFADYDTYDQIDSIICVDRTGDIKTSYNLLSGGLGWILMNDGVISNGNPAIVPPDGIPVGRNNIDTFQLFKLIWNGISEDYTPIYNSAGTLSTRGATAEADFTIGKQLSLTKMLGRAISSYGAASSGGSSVWPIGLFQGEDLHMQTVEELASHHHTVGASLIFSGGGLNGGNDLAFLPVPITGDTPEEEKQVGFNVIQPTIYQYVFIKL